MIFESLIGEHHYHLWSGSLIRLWFCVLYSITIPDNVYCKVYPLQEVMAFLFDTSQGRVNEWIHQLSTVLQMALGKAQVLPERDPKNLEQTLALCVSVDFIIDGTERRVHRPQDAPAQQEKSSGKKKTIP